MIWEDGTDCDEDRDNDIAAAGADEADEGENIMVDASLTL